jgi:hypothetical protein
MGEVSRWTRWLSFRVRPLVASVIVARLFLACFVSRFEAVAVLLGCRLVLGTGTRGS